MSKDMEKLCCKNRERALIEFYNNPPLNYEASKKYEINYLIPFNLLPKICPLCQEFRTGLIKSYQKLEEIK